MHPRRFFVPDLGQPAGMKNSHFFPCVFCCHLNCGKSVLLAVPECRCYWYDLHQFWFTSPAHWEHAVLRVTRQSRRYCDENGHDWRLRSVVDVYYRIGRKTVRRRIIVRRVNRQKAVFSVDGQQITLPYLGVFHIYHGDTIKCTVAVLNDIADGSQTVDLGFEADSNVVIYRTDFWGNIYAN